VKGQTEGELARIDISTPSQVAESDKKIPLPTVSGPPGVVVMQGKTIESALALGAPMAHDRAKFTEVS